MLPQPKVTTLQGNKVLLDEVLGAGFALLRYSDKSGEVGASQFIALTDDIWAKLGVRFVCVQPAIPPGSETVSLPPLPTRISIVRSNEISTFLRRDPNLFVLVRPDRYIFGAFRQEQATAFASAFQRLLQS
jgi:3-(3-hydroxy-phenyl)propionate hydroxylase